MEQLIIYKNGRRYSKIKFSSKEEALGFIKFNTNPDPKLGDWKLSTRWDLFDYPTGEFVVEYRVLDATPTSLMIVEDDPEKKPRKRNFKK